MTAIVREIDGVKVPALLYGTAWKEERTARCVTQALAAGFRGIDTANQRKHYHEAEVGRALQAGWERGTLHRDDIFVQTKFTFPIGQDHRLPYEPGAPVAQQVEQSFESSLSHLGVEKVDSYVLHTPTQPQGLGAADFEAWGAMEALHDSGRARLLGVSNFSSGQLTALLRSARVRPAFVQNRCYAALGWDADTRAVCDREGITYQGFSLLTANPRVLLGPQVRDAALHHGRTPAQVVLRFALHLGLVALTGTTSPQHMADDLTVQDFELSPAQINAIEHAGT